MCRYLLPGIVIVGFLVRLWGINYGFPYGHQYFFETDETTMLHVIMGLGTGDLNPHYFWQPGLFLYVVFVIFGLYYLVGKSLGFFSSPELFAYHYFSDPSDFYLLGRMVSVVFGTLSLVVIYHIGRKAYNRRVGLASAWFLAVTVLHVTLSRTMKTDVTSIFFMLLAISFAIDILRGEALRSYLLAGLFSGLALGTRYPTGLVVVLVVLAHWLKFARRRHGVLAHLLDRRVGLALATCGMTFVLVSPFSVLDFGNLVRQLRALAQALPTTGDPFGIGYRPNYWILHLLHLGGSRSFGAIFLGISILGLIYALWRREGEDLLLGTLPLLFYFLFSFKGFGHDSIPDQYLLPAVACLIILGARFLNVAGSRLGGQDWLRASGVVLLSMPAVVSTLKTDYVDFQPTTMVVAKEWVEQHIPRGSKILMDMRWVPQLTFTKESLERRRATIESGLKAGPSRRKVLVNRSPILDELRVRSLTEVGIPYDLYVILDDSEGVVPPDLDFYERGLKYAIQEVGIEYAIVSDGARERYMKESPYAKAGADRLPRFLKRREFYVSVDELCELAVTFRPNPYAPSYYARSNTFYFSGGAEIRLYRCPHL